MNRATINWKTRAKFSDMKKVVVMKVEERLVKTSPKRRRKRKYVKPIEFLIFGDAPHVSKIIEVKEI